jgi:putative PIN family toxin of toxin-antitoxin system
LRRKRLQKYVTVQTGLKFLELLRINAEWVDVGHVRIKACRDPKDDMFLELAVAGKATHIISGDLDLLVMDPYQEIRILSPRNFLYQAFELRP